MSPNGPWQVQLGFLAGEFVVVHRDDARLRFGNWTSREHAEHFARRLNRRWMGPADLPVATTEAVAT